MEVVRIRSLQGRANEFWFRFLWRLLEIQRFKHLFLLHKAVMVFVKHLSSSVCLSEGPGGNHLPRWARMWRSDQWKRPEIKVFWQRLWRVLVKHAVGAGLWLWYRGGCLPSVVCKRLFRWGWCCDNKLTQWPWIDPRVSFEDHLRF